MKKENIMLTSAYSDFRKEFEKIAPCVRFMSYDWLNLPNKFDFECRIDYSRLIYSQIADEGARDLANEINHLINIVGKLETWEILLPRYETYERQVILNEFVKDAATIALLMPYTLKSRFYFFSAHLSHQANAAKLQDLWVDDFDMLPDDCKIVHQVAHERSKEWKSWKRLNAELNKVDAEDFRTATDDFRNKHTHRLMPRVESGITQLVKRMRSTEHNRPVYGIGGAQPIKIQTVISSLKTQCNIIDRCYNYFQNLVLEQVSLLFKTV